MAFAAIAGAVLVLCVVGLVAVGYGRREAPPVPGPRSPRPAVIWTAWIGGLTVVANASSLVLFLAVFPSIVAALLFWLLPFSLALGVADVRVYVRERRAVMRSSVPPRRWAVALVLSLSIVACVLVVACVALFHDAQLGNLDPGGL